MIFSPFIFSLPSLPIKAGTDGKSFNGGGFFLGQRGPRSSQKPLEVLRSTSSRNCRLGPAAICHLSSCRRFTICDRQT
jgi:hypothetical protein